MSSIRKYPNSKYWYACFTLPNGQQTQRSTRQTDRKVALRMAEKFEENSRRQMSEAQARKVIRELYELQNREPLDSANTDEFLEQWLSRKQLETKPATFARYENVIRQFLKYLGDGASNDLNFVTRNQIAGFQQSVAKRLSRTTANVNLKILRVAFKQACRDGLLQQSPADQIRVLASNGANGGRRPFTVAEIRSVLKHANTEWRGLILFAVYTGQRLKDLATLTCANIDIEQNELHLTTHKTGRPMVIPLADPLREFITENLLDGDRPDSPLFPRAYRAVTTSKSGGVQTLSNAFYEILVASGLADARSRDNTGRGHSVQRQTSPLSFHSFRHTATSLMKNAGIPSAVVQDIIGHNSSAVSRHYTTIDDDSKRKAIEKLTAILEQ